MLDRFLEPSRPSIDLVRVGLSTGDFFHTSVQLASDNDVDQYVAKMVDVENASDLVGGIVAALFTQGDPLRGERMYTQLETPMQRFHVAVLVLDGLAE